MNQGSSGLRAAPGGRRGPRLTVALVVATLLFAVAAPAWAVKDKPPPAISGHRYVMAGEIFLDLGGLVLDPFTKGFAPALGITAHLSKHLAWEIVHAGYVLPLAPDGSGGRTGLREQLEDNFGIAPEQFNRIHMFATTGLMWTPFYGKFSWLNDKLVYMQLSFSLFGGVMRYLQPGGAFTAFFAGIRPTFGAGMHVRFFLNQRWSVRLDVKDYILFPTATPGTELYVAAGIALNIGGGKERKWFLGGIRK